MGARTVGELVDRGGSVVLPRCTLADSWWARARGLLGHGVLTTDSGLLIPACAGVHTIGMRMPIGVVFIGRGGLIVGVAPRLRPFRFAAARGAVAALEVAPAAVEAIAACGALWSEHPRIRAALRLAP
jgi:hypothetical protein